MKKTYNIKDLDGKVHVFETDLEKKGAERYKLDGRSLTGVTTALGAVSKPALIEWSARLCASEAFKVALTADKTVIQKICDELLKYPSLSSKEAKKIGELIPEFKQAASAHRTKSGKAMDVGTQAHAWVEEWAKAKMQGREIALPTDENILKIIIPFVKWIEGKTPVSPKKSEWDFNSIAIAPTTYKVLASEQSVVSVKYFYSGTFDLVLELDGKKYVVDFKTSGGIYGREYAAQCAAYRNALEEMGWANDIEGSIVIRSGKEGDDLEVMLYKDFRADFNYYKAALMLYRGGYADFDIEFNDDKETTIPSKVQ